MKLLIQHRHLKNEIAGVITYVNAIIPELETRGIEVKTISTREEPITNWVKHIFWADIVHMNSNDFIFAFLCRIFHKKIIIKYHYCFYQSIHSQYEQMSFTKRLKAELKYTLPQPNYA